MKRASILLLALVVTGCQTVERRTIQIESRSDAYCQGRGTDPGTDAYQRCFNNAAVPAFTTVVDTRSPEQRAATLDTLRQSQF